MRRRKIFTLVELLIVIAIIAILASMLMPALRGAREKSKALACSNSMKQIGIASLMYVGENQDYFVLYYATGADKYQLQTLANHNYLPENSWGSTRQGLLWCQSNLSGLTYFDYRSNYMQNDKTEANPGMMSVARLPYKIVSIKDPSGKVMFAESGINADGKYYFHGTADRVGWIHSGGSNAVFMDGHVSYLTEATTEIFDLWN
jgi:prepilin-type processing-associated H-X9-DG protein/prepilin-type N-terminal cleavage/methylation domain-containing protein